MAVVLDRGLRQRQSLARGDADLPFDEIETGDHFRHHMLDLEPRVHFDEIEFALGRDELDRAGTAIIDNARRRDRGFLQFGALRIAEAGRGRFLDQLLVSALDRAIALEEMDDIAVAIREDLHLDMPRIDQIFLDQQAIVAEGCLRLAPRPRQGFGQCGLVLNDAHAFAAAAGRGFDQHRIADGARLFRQPCIALLFAMIAGDQRHAGLRHQRFRLGFRAHGADRGGGRADEDDAGRLASGSEIRVLGEEAVTGMDRLRAALLCGVDDPRDVEIALARRGWADQDRFIGRRDMQRMSIGLGINRDRADTEALCRAHHAAGDLAAIGDQDFVEQLGHIRNTPNVVFSIGALRLAEIASASTRRVSAGSMMPSSQSRALA